MIDMKQKPSSPVTMLSDVAEEGAYPHGLCIKLDNESLKRLGIGSSNLPRVGQKFAVLAGAEVVAVEKEDGQMEQGYCVELQLQQIELAAPGQKNEQQQAHEQVARMYD